MNIQIVKKTVCSRAIALYSTSLGKSVRFNLRSERQTSTYLISSTLKSVKPYLDVLVAPPVGFDTLKDLRVELKNVLYYS